MMSSGSHGKALDLHQVWTRVHECISPLDAAAGSSSDACSLCTCGDAVVQAVQMTVHGGASIWSGRLFFLRPTAVQHLVPRGSS